MQNNQSDLSQDLTTARGTVASDDSNSMAAEVRALLRQTYLTDSRPWVVAYSGGKDSTLVLQLVVEVLIELGPRAKKAVYVVSSDTRVEAPNVVEYLEETLDALKRFHQETQLPIEPILVRPTVEQGFWGKLIGLGYPPPTRWFRWCTSNMKIKPSRARIGEITAKHGSVILLLGTRLDESSDRRKRMEGRTSNARGLNPHHDIPNAFVLTPIADWSTDNVWEYLYENNPPPWGQSHDNMLTLYRQANGGECPVVMDLNTPSCGGSRFGCWTCTVVKLDRSMEGFVQSGEERMRPLNEFRNWLKLIREDKNLRLKRRRSGENGIGPFSPDARKMILERLLETEKKSGLALISDDDIGFIQQEWSREFDLSNTALSIAAKFGRRVKEIEVVPIREDERRALSDLCRDEGVDEEFILSLLNLESEFPDLHSYGNRTSFRRKISDMIALKVSQVNLADPNETEVAGTSGS